MRAGKLPTTDDSLAQIEAKAKQFFPLAVEHVNLKPSRGPAGLSGGYRRFEVSSDDKADYLRALAKDFTPKAQGVVKDHWSKFLSGWKMFGMITEVIIGVFFARLVTELITGGVKTGGKARDVRLDAAMRDEADELERIVRGPGGAALVADLRSFGLCEQSVWKEWALLCDPKMRDRIKVDWTRATLPKIAPFLETFFFGGMSTNFRLEKNFSVFGAHIEDEQSAQFKEALTVHAIALESEREERRQPEFRVPKVSKKAQDRYAEQRTHRAMEGQTEELPAADDNRQQLVKRGEQLLARMSKARETKHKLRPELCSESVEAFRVRRGLEWDKLFQREAKVLEGVMREKRKAGTHKAASDPYGQRTCCVLSMSLRCIVHVCAHAVYSPCPSGA